LAGSAASQALTLVERIVASHVGEGAITIVNLARKLVNIPLIGLASLSQVLLSRMSAQARAASRLALLRTGLTWATLLAVPATVGLVFGAAPLVTLLLPDHLGPTRLAELIRLFALALAFGSWNSLLARYFYAQADTRTPLKRELGGNAVTLLLALGLPPLYGVAALPVAATAGVIATTLLLIYKTPLAAQAARGARHTVAAAIVAAIGWLIATRWGPAGVWAQLAVACVLAGSTGAGLAVWLKPGRATA
jgi:peptidoglycan biosynthesis protein MviN/MurJ (putative lipid II flippase)